MMRWMVLLFVLSVAGCDLFFDANGVVYQSSSQEDMPDMIEDMTVSDVDMPIDVPEDAPEDVPTDAPDDIPDIPEDLPNTNGQICQIGGLISGNCDPIIQDCIGAGEACIQLYSASQMTLVSACGPAEAFVKEEGEACVAQDKCLPGLLCSGTCKRMCDRSTGRGCNPDEFCRVFDPSFGFGFCDVSC